MAAGDLSATPSAASLCPCVISGNDVIFGDCINSNSLTLSSQLLDQGWDQHQSLREAEITMYAGAARQVGPNVYRIYQKLSEHIKEYTYQYQQQPRSVISL